ncbi:hypothetical protein N7474_006266 [Penicillium riverlandense]|uniref:uncharacterized protein n=1 Tax=Penicillium riverlandense TaxID=1903569 RepID=UPI002547C5D4|nr:uncharacterized protein N7474_006266 [Penicillium riverlandense]KAJ5814489.1 hypothetical protein N7474_006266 [Penicillium riverlandense]
MTKAEALVLVQKKLDVSEESEDLRQLVEVLEFMPLEIYLEKIRKSDREAIRLLALEAEDKAVCNGLALAYKLFRPPGILESILRVPQHQQRNGNFCPKKVEGSE